MPAIYSKPAKFSSLFGDHQEEEIKYWNDIYEKQGLDIPVDTEVELTDWAKEVGFNPKSNREDGKFIKIRNIKKPMTQQLHNIQVSQLGPNRTGFWAGFWQEVK